MLVDPSAEDPWEHLDFDPDTGNITARYDVPSGSPSAKGECTVDLLQLDRREAMTEGYRRTYQRLVELIRQVLTIDGSIDGDRLAADLCKADEHGLLGWCFGPVGAQLHPFEALRRKDPGAWASCRAAAQQ